MHTYCLSYITKATEKAMDFFCGFFDKKPRYGMVKEINISIHSLKLSSMKKIIKEIIKDYFTDLSYFQIKLLLLMVLWLMVCSFMYLYGMTKLELS